MGKWFGLILIIILINGCTSCKTNGLEQEEEKTVQEAIKTKSTKGVVIGYARLKCNDECEFYTEEKTELKVGEWVIIMNGYNHKDYMVKVTEIINDYWYKGIYYGCMGDRVE